MSGPNQKDAALSSLDEAVREGRADKEVLPLLSILNSLGDYATTSSCAGRIQLIGVPEVGDKQGSEVFGKWHHAGSLRRSLQLFPRIPTAYF